MPLKPLITPCLWFENGGEQAARFYCSVFPNSRIIDVSGVVVTFELDGQRLTALNGGPHYKLTPAFSLTVHCADQAEVDHYWEKLLDGGGKPSRCGWLEDRFGLSWQVVPNRLAAALNDPDPARAKRAFEAMLTMAKLDIAAIEAAADGA